MFFFRSMVSKFVFWSVVLLVLVGITGVRALWNNQNAPTKDFTYWQNQYKTIAYDLASDPAVKEATQATPIEVKQVTVTQFPLIEQDGSQQMRVDRCQSCHIGLENPQMTAEKIIKSATGVSVPTEQVAAYLDSHDDVRALVETLGAHPGIAVEGGTLPAGEAPTPYNQDVEGTETVQPLGIVHSAKLQYGVVTNAVTSDTELANFKVQRANLTKHPFPTFGCTTCHYGSGRDLIQNKAHQFVRDQVQSNAETIEGGGITPIPGVQMLPAKYMEAACAQCHASYNAKTFQISYLPQMQTIARGEQLFQQQACYGCHKIEGYSKGNIGPELTHEGRTKLLSAIEHQLWDPRYQVGTCVMPYFFAARQHNTDNPALVAETVDPRSKTIEPADIQNDDILSTLRQHGYVADAARQGDVDALVTFIASQTGQSYSEDDASRFTRVAAYNIATPAEVPVTVAAGKLLFEQSGCYSCHYIGDPDKPHVTGDPKFGKGGVAGPELSWEGTRHSQQWLVAHYKNPQQFVPGSIMPIFPFSDSQRAALSLWDASKMPDDAGARPVSPDQDLPTAAQQTQGLQNRDVRYMTR